ncbi:MAG: lysophospholipid acyltransferase family protein [Gemmiger sp.]|nr:lysophospholipid acyltransferase family protein [Gemmiger sp.]
MLLYIIFLPIVWLVWHILWRIRVIGRENLVKGRGFVIACNHISDLDPVYIVLAWFGRRMRILAKQELFQNPVVAFVLSSFGAVPIARGKGDTGTLERVVEECKNGTGLLIFPEGTRSKTGEIGPLKSGAFVVAGQAGVDMVPCRILYNTPNGRMKLFCRVRICFGKPIPAAELKVEDPKHSMATLRALKHRLLDAWDTLYEENHF